MTFEMRLDADPMRMMLEGRKTIELRLLDGKRRELSVGDRIVFINRTNPDDLLRVRVKALHRFRSFQELYEKLPLLKCGYTEDTVKTASPADMEVYYSREEQSRFGVLGIEIEKEDS